MDGSRAHFCKKNGSLVWGKFFKMAPEALEAAFLEIEAWTFGSPPKTICGLQFCIYESSRLEVVFMPQIAISCKIAFFGYHPRAGQPRAKWRTCKMLIWPASTTLLLITLLSDHFNMVKIRSELYQSINQSVNLTKEPAPDHWLRMLLEQNAFSKKSIWLAL